MNNTNITIKENIWRKIMIAFAILALVGVGYGLVQGIEEADAQSSTFTSRFCIDLNSSSSPNSNPRQNCIENNMAAEGDLVLENVVSGPIAAGGTENATSTAGWTAVPGYHTAYLCADAKPPLPDGLIAEIDEYLGDDGYPGSGNCMEYAFVVGGTCADGIDNFGTDSGIDAGDPSCYTIPGDPTSGYDPTKDEALVAAAGTVDLVSNNLNTIGALDSGLPISFSGDVTNIGTDIAEVSGGGGWDIAYDARISGPNGKFQAFAHDSFNNVIYAGGANVPGTAKIYRCDTTTGCDQTSDWTLAFDGPGGDIQSLFYDSAKRIIYAGQGYLAGWGDVYRCDTTTGCDQTSDWTLAFDGGATISSIRSFTYDSSNGVMYAGVVSAFDAGNSDLYRCDTTTGCDQSTDWVAVFSNNNLIGIVSLEIDSSNGVLYAGGLSSAANGNGDTYRCDTTTGCDQTSDWTLAFDGSQPSSMDITFDSTNGVVYIGLSGANVTSPGDTYRCDTTTGCDQTSDWTLAFDNVDLGDGISSLLFDSINDVIYMGTNGSLPGDGDIYRCDTTTGCDQTSDWILDFDILGKIVVEIGADLSNQVIYATEFFQPVIYRCDASTGCGSSATTYVSRFCIDLKSDISVDLDPVGNCMAGNFTAGDFEQVLLDKDTGPLSPSASETVTSDTWTAVAGNHTAYICTDPNNAVIEIDDSNNCASYNFSVAAPPLPPVVTFTVNDDPDDDGNPAGPFVSVFAGEDIRLDWTVTGDASSGCTTTDDWLPNNDFKTVGPAFEVIPAVTTSSTYTLSCTGLGGSTVVSVGVTVLPQPNLLVPSNGPITPSAGWDRSTGFYDNARLNYAVENNGTADAGAFDIKLESQFRTNIYLPATSYTVYDSELGLTFGNSVSNTTWLGSGSNPPGIPPGDWQVIITADHNDLVTDEISETDNDRTVIGTGPTHIPAPNPLVELTIDPDFVRYGEITNLHYRNNTGATYDMDCTIDGPSITTFSFNPSDTALDPNIDGDGDPSTGVVTTGPITSKSEFLLKCVEKISGYDDPYTATAVVETTGTVEER